MGGIDSSTIATAFVVVTSTPERRLPVSTPRGIPTSVARRSAVQPMSALLPARSAISVDTDRPG